MLNLESQALYRVSADQVARIQRSGHSRLRIVIKKKNSVALVRERAIPTERPPPVGEISAYFLRIEGCHVVSATDPHGR